MDKDKKKKVAGAAAAAAATGAAAVGAAVLGRGGDAVAAAEPVEDGEILADGGELPEITVTGDAPIADGGELPEVSVTGEAQTEPAISQAEPVVAQAEPMEPAAETTPEAVADAEVIAEEPTEFDTADVAQAEPVEIEEFHDEFDDSDDLMAQAAPKDSESGVIDEFIDKAEEFLGLSGGTEPDMPDFDNAANVNEFTGM